MNKSNYNIEKIIFTGQLLRSEYSYVIDWFYNLLKYYPQTVTGLTAYAAVACDYKNISNDNYISFDVNKFYKFYGYKNYNKLDTEEKNKLWTQIFHNKEFNKEAYEYVYSIFKDSLVISHELSQVVINILEYYNIPYIDINTAPVRFLDDQLFAFRTNDKNIYKEIQNYRTNEELFYMYANYIATTYNSKGINATSQNIVLFLGQTDCDKTLINQNNGEIYSILDHKEDFENAIQGFDKIYYKRHPLVKNDEKILNYISSFDNITIVDENFYKLMSRNDIKKVVAISSGACIEAKYFGKESQVLLRNSIELSFDEGYDKEKYISVYKDFFAVDFWAKILSPIVETKQIGQNIDFTVHKNRLRNSRGAKCYWGYEDFDHEIIKQDTFEVQLQHIAKLEKRLKELEDRSFWIICKRVKRLINSAWPVF